MADIAVHANNDVDQWCKELHVEYVRAMQLRKLMGKSVNMPIQIKRELSTAPGRDIYITLVTRLTGNGVTGDNTLMGNEENLGNYAHKITIDQLRHAVRRGRFEQKKTHFDLLKAGKAALKMWAMSKLRDDIIEAMYSPNVDGTTSYASTGATDRNTHLAANSDRILFGATTANYSGVHATDLAKVDSSADTLSYTIVELMKRRMKLADPHIRPINVNEQGEWYVLLCGSYPFRDLRTSMATYHQYASERGKNNPLYTDGDVVVNGVICKEVPEIPVVSGVGTASIDVSANFMLGAQAVGIAIGEDLHPIKHVDDYGNLVGAGVAEIRGVDKLTQNSIDHGMGTLWTAAVAD